MSPRVYGTWVDLATGLRHYASGVPQDATLFHRKRGEWDTHVTCGKYISERPQEAARGELVVVTCLRCLYKRLNPPRMRDILRGQCADQVLIDEVGFFETSTVTTPADRTKP